MRVKSPMKGDLEKVAIEANEFPMDAVLIGQLSEKLNSVQIVHEVRQIDGQAVLVIAPNDLITALTQARYY